MERGRSGAPPARADRNLFALFVLLAGTALLYFVIMFALAALLEGAVDSLSRDRFWKLLVYWAVFFAPAIPAVAGAALAANRLARPYNRAFLYYVATGFMMIGTVIFCLVLLAGRGVGGMGLALLALATGVLAWLALRRIVMRSAA